MNTEVFELCARADALLADQYAGDTLAPGCIETVAYELAESDGWANSEIAKAIIEELTERHLTAICADAFTRGARFARDIAACNIPDAAIYDGFTIDDARELHLEQCGEALENAKCYSPFEFTAREFNNSPARDELWAAFEAGAWETMARDVGATPAGAYGLAAE